VGVPVRVNNSDAESINSGTIRTLLLSHYVQAPGALTLIEQHPEGVG
jgi:hypothetical protein